MITIYALVWRQAILSAGHHAHSCLSYGGQPTFSSQNACEGNAAPLRQRIARTGAKGSETTIECIARTIPAPRIAE